MFEVNEPPKHHNTKMRAMKTLIIFDIDGTLVYSNKVDSKCFSETYQQIYGEPFPSIDWRVYPHVTDHTIFRLSLIHI